MKTPILLWLFLAVSLGGANPVPAPGQAFLLSPDFPKYVTGDIEFRDPSGVKRPNFYYGKPAGKGSIMHNPANPSGAFTLLCDNLAQKKGDQSRRVLGELIQPDGANAVTLVIQRMGPTTVPAELRSKDKEAYYAAVTGELQLYGRRAPVNGIAELKYSGPGKGDEKSATLRGKLTFTIKGSDLGLKSVAGPIQVTAGLSAYAPQTPAAPPAQKK